MALRGVQSYRDEKRGVTSKLYFTSVSLDSSVADATTSNRGVTSRSERTRLERLRWPGVGTPGLLLAQSPPSRGALRKGHTEGAQGPGSWVTSPMTTQ